MTTAFDPGFQVVPEPSERVLTDGRITDYRAHRERLIRWVLTIVKNPEHADEWIRELADGNSSQAHEAAHRTSIELLFHWRS